MSGSDGEMKIDLNDIVNISENEFKKQISAWIDERGISRKLQSKLRADLFEHFNQTHLGRQMAEQHSFVHRIVLSPLILVLNTLVADFLYAEDCHFTLSVFANEVPYKNTLPNFEATPSRILFRFTESELKDIFEAIGISRENEKVIRHFYSSPVANGSNELLNHSLLYCIFRSITSQTRTEPKPEYGGNSKPLKMKSRKSEVLPLASSTQQSFSSGVVSHEPPGKCSDCKRFRSKHDHFHVSSRYFKYVGQYLDIISDRLNEVLKVVNQKLQKHDKIPTESTLLTRESSLKKNLRKMVDNINRLTKSKRKSKQCQDILNSIEKLSATVDKCSQNMENLIQTAKSGSKSKNGNNLVESSSSSNNNRKDRLKDMDYATWLRELKTSDNGKKFIDRLESSIQKTMEEERANMQKLYDEKTNNYRMLIRLHYKQKYDVNNKIKRSAESQPVEVSSADKISSDNTELADSLAAKAIEKEHHVDQIVQSAKVRLQKLERESEQLDESFQSYLRRQKMMKRQINDDVTHIWDSYSLSKAALEQYDSVSGQANLMHNQPKLINTTNIDQALNFELNENDDSSILRELQEITRIKSPKFDKNEIFSKETVFGTKKPIKGHDASRVVNLNSHNTARRRLHKEFDVLTGLAPKITAPKSPSKKWNPMKQKDIETWKSKVADNGDNLQEVIDDFYRKSNDASHKNEAIKRFEAIDNNNTRPLEAEINYQPVGCTPIEQTDSTIKSKINTFSAESKSSNPEIQSKDTKNESDIQVEKPNPNQFTSHDNDSPKMQKEEHIEPTVIQLNLNSTKPKEVFTRLSSIESGEDASLQISVGPTQPSKSDDFWI